MKNSHNSEHRRNKDGNEHGVRELVTTEPSIKEVATGRGKSGRQTKLQKK